MGVVAQAHLNNSIKTSELANWIAVLRVKKLNFKCQKRKNLFIEAVLNKALTKAESELRYKQQERRLRWQHLKTTWSINPKESCDTNSSIDWDNNACEDLTNSIDEFMSQLKSVDVSIQR